MTASGEGVLHTERLVLRRWTDADRPAFRQLNQDPLVMATIGPELDDRQADGFMNRIEGEFGEHGFGLWCVEVASEAPEMPGQVIGYTGFSVPWFRDGVEIGWRLRSDMWGRGYAPEAARACLADGFGRLGFEEIISFTAVINHKSRRVMDKIGLEYDRDGDFEHPAVPPNSPLSPHVLYRMTAAQYGARRE